tara:strand:+ start:2216 stop:4564 length:2349 start_codon:yes stop_codon:yes gene_type:complete
MSAIEITDGSGDEGDEMDIEETEQRMLEEQDPLDRIDSTESEDRARQQGIRWAEMLYVMLPYSDTNDELAHVEYSAFCARTATGDYPLESDVDVLQAKVNSLLPVVESILTEGKRPTKLDMRLYAVLRTAAQIFSLGDRKWEYGAEVKSVDLQMNSYLHDLLKAGPIASGDNDAYQMAYFIHQRQLRGGRDGLVKLSKKSRHDKLGILCAAREPLAAYMNIQVVPSMFDGQMLYSAQTLCFEIFGDDKHSFGYSSAAPFYFNASNNRDALRRILYSISALAGMSRSGMLAEFTEETCEGNDATGVDYARLGSSREWEEVESLIKATRETFAARLETSDLTARTNPSTSAFCRVFADWFDGCTHDDARFHTLMRAFSAACFTIPTRVPADLRAIWDEYMASLKAQRAKDTDTVETERRPWDDRNCLCLWGAAEFLCSAALSLKGVVMPLHVAYLCVLSGAIGSLCHEDISGPMVFTPFVNVMIRRTHSEIGDLAVADACLSGKMPTYTPSQCGYSIPIKNMLTSDARLQNDKTIATECHVRACVVHLAHTEAWRELMRTFGHSLACIPSERNKQARRIFMRAMMAGPFVAGSDCFHPSGQHFLASEGDTEQAYKYNDIMGGAFVIAILYPIASKALREAVHVKFKEAHSLPRHEQKKCTHSTVECLDEFLHQLSELAGAVFNPGTRLEQPDQSKTRGIRHLAWAELVFRQQICLIQSFSAAVRGAPTLFSRICNATGSHTHHLDDDDHCEVPDTSTAHSEEACSSERRVDADFAASKNSLFST